MKRLILKHLTTLLSLCLLLATFAVPAARADETARDITKKCAFKVSEGEKGKLTDTNVRTRWTYDHVGAWVGVKLPDGVEAGWLRIEWLFDPTGFELTEYDAGQNALRQRDQGDTFPNIYTVFELLPETKYIQLKMTAKEQDVCTVKVYSRGELPKEVQVWEPPVDKADVMLVSTHQDDEIVFMGGTIPYYATARKVPMVVVYMTNCSRYRRNEALNSLWVMGVRNYPEFINLQDKRVASIEEGVKLWGGKEAVLSVLVERIRRFKPEVIVTHDLDGEYGHNQHKITARAMQYAIDSAADPERFPESYERYGAWQVKKLYLHLYKENSIMMDWETPLDSLNGYSPLKVAQMGMQEQASQLKYYRVKSHGTYDNAKFGLYSTTVGFDVAKNDFLENIDPDASAKYLEEHAEEIARQKAAASEAAQAAAQTAAEAARQAEAEAEAQAEAEARAKAELAAAEAAAEAQADAAVGADSGADEAPVPTEAPTEAPALAEPEPTVAPQPANEKSGGAGVAVALIAAGVVVAGAGAYAWYRLRSRRRRKRRWWG